MTPADGHRPITHNALMLAVRMAIVTLTGLYTSRIKLQALGVTDYGILALIASIVAMAIFLNNTMSGATGRFLTFETARGGKRLHLTFATSLAIHMAIAAMALTLAETLGLWFVNTHLDIPPQRMDAANIVYQLTTISLCVTVIQTPYIAVIFAREHMGVFARIEIAYAALRLLSAYLITIAPHDRLILLAGLDTAAAIAVCLMYVIHCRRHWPETRNRARFHPGLTAPMLRFCLLDLYGNTCVTFAHQTVPVIINWFFALAANTAAAIAMTVSNALTQFTASVSRAFDPRITKLYAAGDIPAMTKMVMRSTLMTAGAMTLLALPLWIFTPCIIKLWLGSTPPYTIAFTRLAIAVALLSVASDPVRTTIHATGDIRRLSFISGTLFLLTPAAAYAAYAAGLVATSVYYVLGASTILITLTNTLILRHQIKTFPAWRYLAVTTLTWLPVLTYTLLA